MFKQDIITRIAEKTGKSEYEARMFLEAYIQTVAECMKRDEEVVVRGFGTFKVKYKGPKMVANIHTGEKILVGRTKRVVFEASKSLKQK